MRRPAALVPAALVVAALALAACGGDGSSDPDAGDAGPASGPDATIVFNGQGNDLVAYSTEPPFRSQVVITHQGADPEGLDINAQICFDPSDPRRFVAGEDTYQSTTGHPGWGIFELEGSRVGELRAREVSKLTPTYQGSADNAENYGCAFLPDGRILTTDIGDQAVGDGNGQLIVWYPPFDARDVPYCKLDVTLLTGQGLWVDGDDVYVAEARAGVTRYDARQFPVSPQPEDGCDGTDATGMPLATGITPEAFLVPGDGIPIATPNAVVRASDGHFFVSSVINGVIAELDAEGRFLRTVLEPPAGETLGPRPFSTGTPLGLGLGPDGTLYYADIGIVVGDGLGPGDRTGTVRRIRFVDGEPRAPETMDEGLAFPDGIGVWAP